MSLGERTQEEIHEVTDLDIRIDTDGGPYLRVAVHQLRSEELDLVEQALGDAGLVMYPVTRDGQTSYVYVDERDTA